LKRLKNILFQSSCHQRRRAPLQAELTAGGGDKLKQEVGSFSVFAPTFKIAQRDPFTLNAKESNRLHGLKTKQKAV
jgi:hypothetical protein